MSVLRKFLKKLFCNHKSSEVICWHWTHGLSGNDIRFLQIQRQCNKCHKYYFTYIKNWDECNKFINKYPDREWSDGCKPIL
nr:MAG TPA: cytochrome c protein [Bacteriophage sp.]